MSAIRIRFQLERKNFNHENFKLEIDTSLPGSGVTALFGPSASGKTSLLRCIAGLEKTDDGLCEVNGEVFQNGETVKAVHQRRLGYVFQQANLFEHLNVKQNLLYGYSRLGEHDRHVDYENTLSLLGLSNLVEQKPDQLSGGQRQRVAIGRALLASPQLLLMDEPLASLDTRSKAEILPYLERLHDELDIPMIYVSHNIDEVLRIADHMALMDDGRITAQGALNEMLTRDDLPLAYLDEACVALEGRVAAHDSQYHQTEIATVAGHFKLSRQEAPIGKAVRLRIAARDVSITLSPAKDSSISHILPATVLTILPSSDPAKALVKLNIESEQILASITQRSVEKLKLQTGSSVYAQIKSVALM